MGEGRIGPAIGVGAERWTRQVEIVDGETAQGNRAECSSGTMGQSQKEQVALGVGDRVKDSISGYEGVIEVTPQLASHQPMFVVRLDSHHQVVLRLAEKLTRLQA